MMELEGRVWGDQEVLASLTELPNLSRCVIFTLVFCRKHRQGTFNADDQ